MDLYVLREQTQEFLEQAHLKFNSACSAKLNMDPTDTVVFRRSTGTNSCYYLFKDAERNNKSIWYIRPDLFDQFFMPYVSDDQYLLNQL